MNDGSKSGRFIRDSAVEDFSRKASVLDVYIRYDLHGRCNAFPNRRYNQ